MYLHLCARYGRRLELCGYRDQLEALGHVITSDWLDGEHSDLDTGSNMLPPDLSQEHAEQDLADIDMAQAVIAFTEEPDSPYGRGGRHVEFGYALAHGKLLCIVGPVENIFMTLPHVQHYPTWEVFYAAIATLSTEDTHVTPS